MRKLLLATALSVAVVAGAGCSSRYGSSHDQELRDEHCAALNYAATSAFNVGKIQEAKRLNQRYEDEC